MVRLAAPLLLTALWASVALGAESHDGAAQRPDEELFLVALRLDSDTLAEALPTRVSSEGVRLPLGEVSRLLQLAISVHPEEGMADGWAISEGRSFLLHRSSGTASFDGKAIQFAPEEVEVDEGELFVDIRVLEQVLPIDFVVDLHAASVTVKPREQLPLQVQRERQRQLEKSLAGGGDYLPHYPMVALPYSLWKPPSVDQTVNVTTSRASYGPWVPDLRYTTLATGELLYLQTDLYLSGNANSLPDVRAHAGRKDAEGKLLGPLHATDVGFGEVSSAGLDLVSRSSSGLGVQVSNHPLQNPTHFDRNTFRGDLPPGWDVELYRNGVLIAYQPPRSDGRYEFADIPLYFGMNSFRQVFHGPQGQVREEREAFNIGPGLLPAGELQYRLTANLPSADGSVTTDNRRSQLELDYGLVRSVSASLALATAVRHGKDKGYAKASLNAFHDWLSGTADVATETGGGMAAQGTVRAQLGWFRATAQHVQLWDYDSEQFDSMPPLTGRSLLRLDARVPMGQSASLPLEAELRRDWLVTGAARTEMSLGAAAKLARLSLSEHVRVPLQSDVLLPPTAQTMALLDLGPAAVRLSGDCQLKPWKLSGAALTVESRGLGSYFVTGGASWLPGDVRYQAGVGKTEGIFALSLNGSYSAVSGATAMLSLAIAFKHDERKGGWDVQARNAATAGAASARVFLDTNGNGVMDGDEEALKNVQLAVNGMGRDARTDGSGVAVLPTLNAYAPADIGVLERSLEDPYWKPALQGYQLVPRPGRMATLEFPIQMTGEVTGTLYTGRENEKRELSGVDVELVSDKGQVFKTRSAYDGFYTLPGLLAGKYTLRVAPEQLAARGLAPIPPREVVIAPNGTVLDGFDLVVPDPKMVLARLERAPARREPARVPADRAQPFEIDSPEGPIEVRAAQVARFPLASWAAGLPLSEEEIQQLEQLGSAVSASPRNRLLIVSHAQTLGSPEGAIKRAGKGGELLKRYLKAVQFVPAKKVTVSVIPPEPGGEPLGFIELVLVERTDSDVRPPPTAAPENRQL